MSLWQNDSEKERSRDMEKWDRERDRMKGGMKREKEWEIKNKKKSIENIL